MRLSRLLPAALAAALLAPAALAQGDLDAQLDALQQREQQLDQEIEQKITALRTEFATADEARKKVLQAEGQQMVEGYAKEVQTARGNLLAAAAAAPQLSEKVATFATVTAFGNNDYAAAEGFAAKLLAANPQSPAGLNLLPVSQFALHKFAEAGANFEKAREAGVLSPDYAPLAQAAPEYERFWPQEQALRAKQASMNLPQVRFTTSRGPIVLELFEEEAPNTVANIISLAESGYYDGIEFHRVIPNFMAQGGDPLTKNDDPSDDGTGGPGYTIPDEVDRPGARKHFRGSLSMAKTSAPNTGGSQFFLTHMPTPHLNGLHTVYGRVIQGQEVVDALQIGDVIQKAEVLRKRNHPYQVQKAGA